MARPSDWDVLDLSSDPTPGDPTVVSGLGREWDSVADDAEAAERGVRSLASDGAVLSWIGAAGEVFKAAIGEFPGQLGKCKDSYRQGASALRTWSADLAGAQSDADRALALGREAKADLHSAQAALGSAQSSASSASSSASSAQQLAARYADTPPPAGVTVPDPAAVRSSVRTAQVAQSRVDDAHAAVGDAQSRLDAARKMALDAKDLRESRAKVAAGDIHDASQAGIKPNSFMEDLGNLAGQVWDAVIAIAKVVVLVLGVVALIIGGPLAWIVFAAAVLILADTIAKALQGKASWWDVAFAALGCIPGTKGLTTFKALSSAFKEGGALAAAVHVIGAGKNAVVEIAGAGRQLLSKGRSALTTMASTVRSGLSDVRTAMVSLREGASSVVATLKMEKQVLMHRLSGGEMTPQGDMIIRRYTPAQKAGPLGENYPADTFRSASYNEVILRRPSTLYRSVNDFSNPRGEFWARTAPRGPLHTQLDLALKPEWLITNRGDLGALHQTLPQATSHVEATFPRGTTIFEGPTAPQFSDGVSTTSGGVSIPGSVLGGGNQVVPNPDLISRWNEEFRAAEKAGIDYVDPYGLVDHRPAKR